jgi:hypothetical protein
MRALLLVQLPSFVPPDEIFTEYAYYSAYSTSWVEHARTYVEMSRERLALGPSDFVVELASNDGYLLQHFVGSGIPILGVDPAANVAVAAEEREVPTLVAFFGRETAQQLVEERGRASLVVGTTSSRTTDACDSTKLASRSVVLAAGRGSHQACRQPRPRSRALGGRSSRVKDPGFLGGSDARLCPGGRRCSGDGETEEVLR